MSTPEPNSSEPPKRKRFQFSLGTLMLSALLAGSLMYAAYQNREILRKNNELDELAWAIGLPKSIDSKRAFVKSFNFAHPGQGWAWRVLIPKNHEGHLCYASENIPRSGLPPHDNTPLKMHGIATITSFIDRNDTFTEMELTYEYSEIGGRGAFGVGGPHISLRNNRHEVAESAWVAEECCDDTRPEGGHDPAKSPLVLLRVRQPMETADKKFVSDPEPCRGFMIWLEFDK